MENTTGVYQRVLAEHCLIRRVLNQDTTRSHPQEIEPHLDQNLLVPVVPLIDTLPPENTCLSRLSGEDRLETLDDYVEWARDRLASLAADKAVAFKTCALPDLEPNRKRAIEEFQMLKATQGRLEIRSVPGPLLSYIRDELLKAAAGLGLPVAVHTGFWGDFRRLNPTHMIPFIQRYPGIHFDLFHLGVPWVRETGIIAANFPNVSVNMCWAHSMNAVMARSALDEYIDLLGDDKIIGFRGDVRWMVHKVYGHLELARRNVASVLTRRIMAGRMDLDEAERLTRMWFFDNPARIYRLTKRIGA